MENEILLTAIFVSAGLLACVIIPGLLDVEGRGPEIREDRSLRRMWDRVLDPMESSSSKGMRLEKTVVFDHSGTGDQKK